MKRSTAGLVLTLLLVVLVLVSVRGPQPPSVVPADAPADQFSAARASEHLEAIARKPHPMGSPEHARVRDYIMAELASLGVQPQIQEATASSQFGRRFHVGRVVNVVARLEGREDGKALLLMSHYDTVPTSPGAGDDSSGVAAMLETLRALKAGETLKNDVIFLFTDGEEVALLGARAFVDEHPWAQEVGVVMNFEARGSRGPSLMFETSRGNAPLMRAFGHAVDRPSALSFSYEVYRRMPNDTDYTPFKTARVPGLNFSFIHGPMAYHSSLDNLERLDLRSVQHHGDAALSLARELGQADMGGDWATRDAIYFNFFGPIWIRYSGALALPLTILLLLGTGALLFVGMRRGKLSAGGLAGGLLVTLVGAALAGGLLLLLAPPIFEFYNFELWNGWTSTSLQFLAVGLIAAALVLVTFLLARKKIRAENLFGGGLVVWALLMAVVTWAAPGASYLFAVPLLFVLAAGALWLKEESDEEVTLPFLVLLVLSMGATVFLWAPTLALLGVALGGGAAVVLGAFLGFLFLAPLAPSLALMFPGKGRTGWAAAGVLAILGVALVLAVGSASRFDARNPRMSSLLYYFDSVSAQGQWISFDRALNPWTSAYLTDSGERLPQPTVLGPSARSVLTTEAPAVPLLGAALEWLGEEDSEPGRRWIRLRLNWPYEVHRGIVVLRSDSHIYRVSSGQQSLGLASHTGADKDHRTVVNFHAPPSDGVELAVELGGDGPLEIDAVAQFYELPQGDGFLTQPRPADLMPYLGRWGWLTDSTFVRSAFTWSPGVAGGETPEEMDEETPAAAPRP